MSSQSQSKAKVGALIFDKAHNIVAAEYSNYSNVLLTENATQLPNHIKINNHAIKLEEDKQSFFSPIYSLRLKELEI